MSVRHQVSDELLMDYASGSLGESWSLAVSTHLALCPESRQRLEAMEMTGGALLTAIEPADRSVDADWEKIRGLLSANVTPSPAKAVAPKTDDAILPEPLRSYAGGDVDKLKWKQLGPGAYHFPIRTRDGEANVRLLRIPAGKPVPEHTHGGRELTVGRIFKNHGFTGGAQSWFWSVEFHQTQGRVTPHNGQVETLEEAKAAWRKCWDSADMPINWPPTMQTL